MALTEHDFSRAAIAFAALHSITYRKGQVRKNNALRVPHTASSDGHFK